MVTVSFVSSCSLEMFGFSKVFPLISEAYINNTGSVSNPDNSFPHWHLPPSVGLINFLLRCIMRKIKELIQVENKI